VRCGLRLRLSMMEYLDDDGISDDDVFPNPPVSDFPKLAPGAHCACFAIILVGDRSLRYDHVPEYDITM
jgi:hypothetical protein